MTESEENEISFTVKFLGRIEVRHPEGLQTLNQAAYILQNPDKDDKEKTKKNKAHLFLSISGIDILEYKTKFMIHSCPLDTVSFCAVHPTQPKLFGFIAKHPASDIHHCYVFQCKKFSHLLVTLIGDTFKASQRNVEVKGSRDLVVEAYRLRIKALQKENDNLKRRLKALGSTPEEIGDDASDTESSYSQTDQSNSQVRFNSAGDRIPLIGSN